MRQYLTGLNTFYGFVVQLRKGLYDAGVLKSRLSPVPCIGVGNLTVGGTGKTPMVEYISNRVHGMGYRVALVSRGYKRKGNPKDCVLVTLGEKGSGKPIVDVSMSGDEAYLLSKRLPYAAVVVCANRYLACKTVFDRNLADVIIMDDGFQHFALKRDADVVLIDATKELASQTLLPAGDLRESLEGLKRASIVIHTKVSADEKQCFLKENQQCVTDIVPDTMQLKAYYVPDACYCGTGEPVPMESLSDLTAIVVAGIAVPKVFVDFVSTLVVGCESFALADHAHYDRDLMDTLFSSLDDNKKSVIITTEKDWVKMEGLLTEEEKSKVFIISQSVRLANFEVFDEVLQGIIKKAKDLRLQEKTDYETI